MVSGSTARSCTPLGSGSGLASVNLMSSFDVVSEVDRQEVRNAIDQAQREISTRFDFKNTDSSIEQNELSFTLRSVTEDRLNALRVVLEEKLVKRGVSLKGLEYGKVEEATQNTVRQVATLTVGTPDDDLATEVDEVPQHRLERQLLRAAVDQGQGDHAERDLQLGELVQLVEDDVRRSRRASVR